MRNLLMVMAPRDLEEEHASLRALPVDQVWFRGFTEASLVGEIARVIDAGGYENYLLVSDDVIASVEAYQRVAALLEVVEAATGYCRHSPGHHEVNITTAPVPAYPFSPGPWWSYDEARDSSTPVLRTWFAGWALSGMRRELWQRFPFRAFTDPPYVYGTCSDHHAATRLHEAGVTLRAHRDAFVEHTRRKEPWLVGRITPRIDCYPSGDPWQADEAEVRTLRAAVEVEERAYRIARRGQPEGYLLSGIDGDSPALGLLKRGCRVTQDASGHPLTIERMRELGRGSEHLRFVEWPAPAGRRERITNG